MAGLGDRRTELDDRDSGRIGHSLPRLADHQKKMRRQNSLFEILLYFSAAVKFHYRRILSSRFLLFPRVTFLSL